MPTTTKKPTPAQKKLLRLVQHYGVERRCYTSQYPGGMSYNWYWMVRGSEQRVTDRTVSTCESRGWITEQVGDPIAGTEHMSPLQRAMVGKQTPRWIELTEAGEAQLRGGTP